MIGRFFGCLSFAVLAWAPLHAQEADNVANIGVLAYRGEQQLEQKWSSLKAYLDASVSGWQFKLVPITLKTAKTHAENGDLHFILTNPGHFSVLDRDIRMSVIASRQRRAADGTFVTEFGSVIFARRGAGIEVLQDVVGKTVAAVDRQAFGGFQLAWREFEDVGVDVFRDASQLTYVGFPMDQVFAQVLSGRADVGVARSGLIEILSATGTLDRNQLVILNKDASYGHPELLSTRLYPEWPFAALAGTPTPLRDAVTLALLNAGRSPLAKSLGMADAWSSPMPYHAVRELTVAFDARLAGLGDSRPWYATLGTVAAVLAALAFLSVAGLRLRRHRVAAMGLPPAPVDVAPDDAHHVTPREREVLDLISQGDSTKEIARKLGISPKTVEFHRSNLLRKYGARTSSQLIALSS